MVELYDGSRNQSLERLPSSEDDDHRDEDDRDWGDSGREASLNARSSETADAQLKQTSTPLVEGQSSRSLWSGFTALVTFLLCASIVVVVKAYSVKSGMPSTTKHAFETITTALLIFLGLNFNVSKIING